MTLVRSIGLSGAWLLAISCDVCAQTCADRWVLRQPVGPRPHLVDAGMAYDAARSVCVLIGRDQTTDHLQVWEWDGERWELVGESEEPSGLWGFSVEYDSVRGKTLLFGGGEVEWANLAVFGWDGREWGIEGQFGFDWTIWHSMGSAYDAARHQIVAGGGVEYDVYWDAFVLWDGEMRGPDCVCSCDADLGEMEYDPVRQVTVQGWSRNGVGVETREWDGRAWRSVALGPECRPDTPLAKLAFDSRTGNVLAFSRPLGGTTLNAREWTGACWNVIDQSTIAPNMESEWDFACATDTRRGKIVVFAPSDNDWTRSQTWEFDSAGHTIAAAAPYVESGPISTVTTEAIGPGPFAYQWRLDGVPLVESRVYSGVQSAELTIIARDARCETGLLDCTVTSACGWATSSAVRHPAPFTVGDFNNDGGIDGSDVESFFRAFAEGDSFADVNCDGGVDGGDVERFFRCWEAGTC